MAGRLFTSESVTEGHPDKIADQISDTVLDYLMENDADKENLRVAVETLLTTGLVVVAGEVRTNAYAPVADLVRKKILEIGYDSSEKGFDGTSCGVQVAIGAQSADIAAGVDEGHESRVGDSDDDLDKRGAGDQGLMFGYACDDTPELMPLPIMIAQRLAQTPDRGPQGRHARLPAPRRQDPGHDRVRRGRPSRPHRHRGPVDPARRGRRARHPRGRHQAARDRPRARDASTSPPRATACWSTRPASSSSAARWATPA